MPYIHSSSSVMYPSMHWYGYGYPSHHGHGYHSSRRHSSSGGYYGMPTQHYYPTPNYAYGGGGGYYGGGYGGYGYSHGHGYSSRSHAPVVVTHSGHGHRSRSRSSSRHRSGFLGYLFHVIICLKKESVSRRCSYHRVPTRLPPQCGTYCDKSILLEHGHIQHSHGGEFSIYTYSISGNLLQLRPPAPARSTRIRNSQSSHTLRAARKSGTRFGVDLLLSKVKYFPSCSGPQAVVPGYFCCGSALRTACRPICVTPTGVRVEIFGEIANGMQTDRLRMRAGDIVRVRNRIG
ncbi:hypothetical protein B0H11DRAFT_1922660 [Mycena galericulata]|nr:hypothetical protein B0H11DRAFT_1922660 [Mycena galericulata]